MSDGAPVPPNIVREQEEIRLSKKRKVAMAFDRVFGQPSRRGADQRLVIEVLREACGYGKAIFRFNHDGMTDTHAAAHRDGAQTQFLIIERNLQTAREIQAEEKAKPKVKRA